MDISTLIDSNIFVAIASALGGVIITVITQYLLNKRVPFAALVSFLIGWLVLVPGAYTVRAWRKIRDWAAG